MFCFHPLKVIYWDVKSARNQHISASNWYEIHPLEKLGTGTTMDAENKIGFPKTGKLCMTQWSHRVQNKALTLPPILSGIFSQGDKDHNRAPLEDNTVEWHMYTVTSPFPNTHTRTIAVAPTQFPPELASHSCPHEFHRLDPLVDGVGSRIAVSTGRVTWPPPTKVVMTMPHLCCSHAPAPPPTPPPATPTPSYPFPPKSNAIVISRHYPFGTPVLHGALKG
ncbi:hypothetical protein BKA83DRAFT_4120445 [Pisolithus microcarpus]|nr:hypothetical protein BKA83DRAFT_4120445 [Pisolithus microcarpus]